MKDSVALDLTVPCVVSGNGFDVGDNRILPLYSLGDSPRRSPFKMKR